MVHIVFIPVSLKWKKTAGNQTSEMCQALAGLWAETRRDEGKRMEIKTLGVMSDLFTSISSGHAGCDPCQRVVGLGGDGARRSETTHVPKARPGSVSVL